MTLTRRGLVAALPSAALLPTAARAQDTWPDRPVRFVVPFPGGSSPDLTGRVVADHLGKVLGQPVVVDNRAGAGGNIGTDAIAKATDGHVIGLSINGPLSTAPALYPALPYDPVKDLIAVSLLVRGPQFLVVNNDLPVTDLPGFLAHVRANPGKLAFGSVGPGSGGHLGMVDLLARTGGLEMLHVSYRGFAAATLDLVAGRIQAMMVTTAAVLGQVQAGQVRPIAVTSANRFALDAPGADAGRTRPGERGILWLADHGGAGLDPRRPRRAPGAGGTGRAARPGRPPASGSGRLRGDGEQPGRGQRLPGGGDGPLGRDDPPAEHPA